jgi:chloride channel 3/4/5
MVMATPKWGIWGNCSLVGEATCIQPGVYGLIAAGSTMCGVTRLSVTLAVILFELTGSLDYVLPFSLAILVAKWTADAIEPHSIYVSTTKRKPETMKPLTFWTGLVDSDELVSFPQQQT